MIPRHNKLLADRFVAIRTATDFEHLASQHPPRTPYARLIYRSPRRCLSFSKHKTTSTKSSEVGESAEDSLKLGIEGVRGREKRMNPDLVKRMEAYQVIYAPNVADNYYGQRLGWSAQGVIGICIQSDCYLYSNQRINRVSFNSPFSLDKDSLTSLRFNAQGTLLFLGGSCGGLQVIDLAKLVGIRSFVPHSARIGCIENSLDWGVLTGSKDHSIAHHDLRMPNPLIMKLVAHQHQVCGLAAQNGKVASGGNDGTVLLWNLTNAKEFRRQRLHNSAVKAMQWCPWRANLLATGGGSKDHKVLLWNSQTEEVEQTLQGKSQVTGVAWRESSRDLVSTHGGTLKESYGMIWSSKIKEFTHVLAGHTKRIVGLAVSPIDHSQICTLGADQTMRFWQTKRESLSPAPASHDHALSSITFK